MKHLLRLYISVKLLLRIVNVQKPESYTIVAKNFHFLSDSTDRASWLAILDIEFQFT